MARRSSLKAQTGEVNVIGQRLRLARHRQEPPLTFARVSELVRECTPYSITANALIKIEMGARAVYDYEVAALAIALDIAPGFLLGLTDDPWPPLPPRTR